MVNTAVHFVFVSPRFARRTHPMSFAQTLQERSLGRYSLIASLGRGGMADIYLAVAAGIASFNKLLVLKALRPGATSELVEMFLDEARLSARFNHPNIVQTYEVSEAGGRYFIALEYLEGQALRAVQRKLGHAFPVADELRALIAVARGLDYAHELKNFDGEPLHVVHRDVSPQNVFLTYDGQVKLLDFGIAKSRSSLHHTQVGLIKGKLDYIAPEQVRGDAVDRRADIFALGVMAWEAVTRQPFSGGRAVTDVAKLHKRLTGGEPDVQTVRPDVPEPLAKAIRCALSLDPAMRFATAGAFADSLEAFLEASRLRPSHKTLSAALARPYADVQTGLKSVIEAQLKRISRDGGRDTSLLVLEPGDATSSHYGVVSSYRKDSISPSVSLAVVSTQPSRANSWAQRHASKLAVLAGTLAFATISALLIPQHGLDATKRVSAAALPVAARSRATDRPSAARPSPSAQGEQTVEVAVRVAPQDAHVELDGAALPELPFRAQLRRDGLLHRVVASAPGYVTKTVAVPFDRDRELSLALERVVAAPARAPVHVSRARVPERRERESDRAWSEREQTRQTTQQPPPQAVIEPGASIPAKRRVTIDVVSPYDN